MGQGPHPPPPTNPSPKLPAQSPSSSKPTGLEDNITNKSKDNKPRSYITVRGVEITSNQAKKTHVDRKTTPLRNNKTKKDNRNMKKTVALMNKIKN